MDAAPAEEASAGGLTAAVLAIIDAKQASLTTTRRKRKPAPGYATADEVKEYVEIEVIPSLHSTSPPGITALDVLSEEGESDGLVVTGGMDKSVQICESNRIVLDAIPAAESLLTLLIDCLQSTDQAARSSPPSRATPKRLPTSLSDPPLLPPPPVSSSPLPPTRPSRSGPMVVRLLGRVTEVSLLLENAASPMVVTVSGRETEERRLLKNA